jgi:hypothetical protein
VVRVSGQSNQPHTFSYADAYGQRTVQALLRLEGETIYTFNKAKQDAAVQIVGRTLNLDPGIKVQDDGVHLDNITADASGGDSIILGFDISASNVNVASAIVNYLMSPQKLEMLQNFFGQAGTEINVRQLSTVSAIVTSDIYCSPGQQPQQVSGDEKACFLCPVGTFQPLRSKSQCPLCPTGMPLPEDIAAQLC